MIGAHPYRSMFAAKQFIEVSTGEVRTCGNDSVLIAPALGSCVAVAVYDPERRRGGMAHIMLPGRSSPDIDNRCRYAEDAIDELLRLMDVSKAGRDRLGVVVAGGGNVLQRADDRICGPNIESVLCTLHERGFVVRARSLGGTMRRRLYLDVGARCVLCAEGDDREMILWHA